MASGVGAPPATKAFGWGSSPPALQLLLVEPRSAAASSTHLKPVLPQCQTSVE